LKETTAIISTTDVENIKQSIGKVACRLCETNGNYPMPIGCELATQRMHLRSTRFAYTVYILGESFTIQQSAKLFYSISSQQI